MQMMLYHRLPQDLQRMVRGYLTVWQRLGFDKEPDVIVPDPGLYYRNIRRRPRAGRWHRHYPNSLHYRRQSHFFEWHVWIRANSSLHDIWTIEMHPQWDFGNKKGLALRAMELRPWEMIRTPSCRMNHAFLMDHDNMMLLEYSVIRADETSPPTRQSMADMLMEYIIEMAQMIENDRRKKK